MESVLDKEEVVFNKLDAGNFAKRMNALYAAGYVLDEDYPTNMRAHGIIVQKVKSEEPKQEQRVEVKAAPKRRGPKPKPKAEE